MEPVLLTTVLGLGGKLIEAIFPDKGEQDRAKLALFELQQKGDLESMAREAEVIRGQLEVNMTEAAHANVFVSGWRPAMGWVCVQGFLYQFIFWPIANGLFAAAGAAPSFPELDIAPLMALVTGMLGLGGMRTLEKFRGVAR